jgi:N4-gp56 family major capsid protein
MPNKHAQYKDPAGGTASSIGPQMNTFFYQKKALIELVKEQYFTPLADVTAMPKNFGKKIKRFHYLPLLDDRNLNDQGINAAGVEIANGNLYGSSKDVGTISGKLPALTENGGRVNRVGFKRLEIEGSMEKFGFFDEYTQESLDFDTDSELMMHINREMLRGANQMTEAALQIDLLNSAGIVVYGGAATQDSEVTGEGATKSVVTYEDLMRLSITLDNNRTPKQTKVISGSRMTDTKVIAGGRIMYVGSEMIPTLRKMTDSFGNPAFIPVQHYADAGNIVNGEIGAIDQFRIVVVPEMLHWAGAGATVTTNGGYYEDNDKYNIYPMLVVGAESFTTIGFQTDGKTVKFTIYHKAPGEKTADRNDPYGEVGFMSIKWYYGFMPLRTERLALVKTVAEM